CLIALGAAVRLADPSSVPWLRNFVIVFGSLLVEATPFILLGAAVSAAIEVFVPSSVFARIALLPRAFQLPAAAAAGVAFPVCECGSVPVARRLTSKGLAPSAAITFMLAAPIVNPVVVGSTFIAYRGRDTMWTMVLGRLALGFVVAMTVGWVMGRIGSDELLRARSTDPQRHEEADEPKGRRFFDHLAGDTMFMARFLIVGAALAAAIQTFVPRSVVDGVASLPVLSLLAMMALAFVMSLCSESDAFVAASFTAFGPSAQLAFLVFGPMVDLKLTALYMGTYRRGFLRAVVLTAGTTTLVCTLWMQVIWG
ncbi:MAG TPA: permease, partial [Actinomycetota bacterium]|nr:permease [Actinomycetota bacterium]